MKQTVKPPERRRLLDRHEQLKQERSSWLPVWKEVSENILPRNGRFLVSDRNKGDDRYNRIYDSTGMRALNTLGSGMMSGATSPARPWFRLSINDQQLSKEHAVKVWLNETTQIMQTVFNRSNAYQALHSIYEELGAFGTAASLILFDRDTVIHCYNSTVGEFAIGTNYKGQVDTIYREFQKTVAELIKEFGYDNCSDNVQQLYKAGRLGDWITIVHAIEPRADRDSSKDDAKNMPYGSYYFELNSQENKYLRESGFRIFPAVAPRWSLAGGDIYGSSPGMAALGHVKQLTHETLRKGQVIDINTDPPLQVPTSLKNRDIEAFPGGMTYVDMSSGGIRTMYETRIGIGEISADIQDVRMQINQAFYADLFLMLTNAADTRMTATEVAERHEEKLVMLGPVIERLRVELLKPFIDITFERMIEAGIVPTAPPELQGIELDVEFTSVLAQAQKAIGVNSIDRFLTSIGAIAQFKPEVLDNINPDKIAELYADNLGIDPEILLPKKDVDEMRQNRAKAQAQAAMAEQAKTQSETARNLSQAQTGPGNNILMDMMGQTTGYSSPSPLEVAQ